MRVSVSRHFCVYSRCEKDLVGHTITIREYILPNKINRVFEPQTGSYLRVESRYAVRIYDDYTADCLEQLDLSMDECFERFPWFFNGGYPT